MSEATDSGNSFFRELILKPLFTNVFLVLALLTVFYIAENPIRNHQTRVEAQSIFKQEQAKTLLKMIGLTNNLR